MPAPVSFSMREGEISNVPLPQPRMTDHILLDLTRVATEIDSATVGDDGSNKSKSLELSAELLVGRAPRDESQGNHHKHCRESSPGWQVRTFSRGARSASHERSTFQRCTEAAFVSTFCEELIPDTINA